MNLHSTFVKTALTIICILGLLPAHNLLQAETYYVDATDGNDSNSGTSPSEAWQSISKINNTSFQPGDQILFQRGEVWTERLQPSTSGTSNSPITYSAYGSGIKPTIDGEGLKGYLIYVRKSHLRISSIKIINSDGWAIWNEPPNFPNHSDYIYNLEYDDMEVADNSSAGGMIVYSVDNLHVENSNFVRYKNNAIALMGSENHPVQNTRIINNYFDSENNANGGITMHENNTNGALPGNNHTIKDNEFYNHREEAMDIQGGDVLIEGNLCVNGGYHGIVASRSNGNIKILRNKIVSGGIGTGNGIEIRVSDVTIAYNIINGVSYRGIAIMDPGSPNNIKIYNNTIYQPEYESIILNCTGLTDLEIVNNIIYNTNTKRQIMNFCNNSFSEPGWNIDNNMYYTSNSSDLFWEEGPKYMNLDEFRSNYNHELNGFESHPDFVDPENKNFSLSSNSPAIDKGISTGISSDINGNPVPSGGAVDIGASEFVSSSNQSLLGDVDFNGTIQSYDAATTLQYSLGMNSLAEVDPTPWSTERTAAADVDGNGSIQAHDAALIQQYVIGLIGSFPAE